MKRHYILKENQNTPKDKLILGIKTGKIEPDQLVEDLLNLIDDDILEDYYNEFNYDEMLTEGKWGRRLAALTLAATSTFGAMHADAAEPVSGNSKEISSTVFTKDIQKEFGIKNVTLDQKAIMKLGEDVKNQIKTDWEDLGYDNTNITKTDGWAKAKEIKDTLEMTSPYLSTLFQRIINSELHNKLKITPML